MQEAGKPGTGVPHSRVRRPLLLMTTPDHENTRRIARARRRAGEGGELVTEPTIIFCWGEGLVLMTCYCFEASADVLVLSQVAIGCLLG